MSGEVDVKGLHSSAAVGHQSRGKHAACGNGPKCGQCNDLSEHDLRSLKMENHRTFVDLQEAKEVCKVVRPEDGLFLGMDIDDVGTSSRNKRTKSFRCGANQVCLRY